MRWHAVVAVLLACVTALANAANLLFLDFYGLFIAMPWAIGTFAAAGLLVALRRPAHPVGWLFLMVGTCFALAFFLTAYSWRALVDAPGTLPAGDVAAWGSQLLWTPATGSMLAAVMLFPGGRPLSRRWAIAMAAMAAVFALVLIWTALVPTPIVLPAAFTSGLQDADYGPDRPTIPNRFAVGGPAGDVLLALTPFAYATFLPFVLLALVTVVVRFARSSGTERLQLKWFAYAASVVLALFILAVTLPPGIVRTFVQNVFPLVLAFLPIAAGIAILRYRLYDIDLLINRTLVYGATSAGLLATYVLSVLALSTLLRPLTGSSDVAVAGSTLAVVALFGPLRARIQRFVDRRFFRSRYDASSILDAFAARLRDQVDLGALEGELLDVVRDTVRPAHASIWLRAAKR